MCAFERSEKGMEFFMKFLKIIFILIILLSSFSHVYADDISYEILSEEDLKNSLEVSTEADEIPNINARHAVILDRNSLTVLYGKNENEQCKMASTTKIMTAIVVIENSNLADIVTVSSKAAGTGGSRLGLSTNDQITVEDLLYGLMLCSGNDAAVALAEFVGGNVSGFADMMNSKATSLGLVNTHFVTPHGLDNDDHYTTAYELSLLADYALKNDIFKNIVGTKSHQISINGNSKTLSNTNELLGNLSGVYGVKTGFTNGANRCLVTSTKRDNLDIICVVLGCDTKKNRTQDSTKLITYAFDNFTVVDVKSMILNNFEDWKSENSNSFFINKGCSQNLDMKLDIDSIPYSLLAVNKNNLNSINTLISCNFSFEAPVSANLQIGTLTFKIKDTEYFTLKIFNGTEVLKKNTWNYFSSFILNFSNYLQFDKPSNSFL